VIAMIRQLDQRTGDGLTVTLEWDSDTDRVLVRCDDESAGGPVLRYPVRPCDARLAFLHPFAARPLAEVRPAEWPTPHRDEDPPLPGRPEPNRAPAAGGNHLADHGETDDMNDTLNRRRRWYHLRPRPRPDADEADLACDAWWPL
jgi:hypothetical protein